MLTLFPDDNIFPSGFIYKPGFLDQEEEEVLLKAIKNLELHNMIFQGYEAKRKTASFGYDWSFDKRVLTKGKQIPYDFNWLVEKVAAELKISKENIAELLVTEYPEGSVINWHRDAPPFDIIIGLSLQAGCIFKFRPYDKSLQNRKSIRSFNIEPRSMYIMSGESRSDWEHSIAPLKSVRYSITLRTLKANT